MGCIGGRRDLVVKETSYGSILALEWASWIILFIKYLIPENENKLDFIYVKLCTLYNSSQRQGSSNDLQWFVVEGKGKQGRWAGIIIMTSQQIGKNISILV